MSDFTARVLSIVRRIPVGRVATYGDVAAAAGSPRASRAVGNIMRECARRDVPCHRVVAAAGRLGGYGGNVELKRALLRAEGLTVTRTTIRDFGERRWPSVAKEGKKRSQSGEPAPSERPNRRVEPSRGLSRASKNTGESRGNVNPAWLRLR
jgi:methylated-DNA-[protein]-cysteine S-methyltransferase